VKTEFALGVHLRDPGQLALLDPVPEQWPPWSETGPGGDADRNGPGRPRAERIYIGDEFCPHRLPNPDAVKDFAGFARTSGLGLTLLTPSLTDPELDKQRPMFDSLARFAGGAEVVVNDLGVLLDVRACYPSLTLVVGRLLNRGFKDPRIPDPEPASRQEQDLLTDCTFRQPGPRDLLKSLGVQRLERDLLPLEGREHRGDGQGIRDPERGRAGAALFALPGLLTSIYFPFGYFTTGRVCWLSSFERAGPEKHRPAAECSRPCQRTSFATPVGPGSRFEIVQNGNTFFYRYAPEHLRSLLRTAGPEGVRLVYQGFAIS